MTDQPSPYGGASDVCKAPRIRIPHLKQMKEAKMRSA